MNNARITIPEVLQHFKKYHLNNFSWGSLHIVLEDQNILDHHVDYCIDYAKTNDDLAGYVLALILRRMSKTQRLKLSYIA